MAAIYQSELWCDYCIDAIKLDIAKKLWAELKKDQAITLPDGTNSSDFGGVDDIHNYLEFMADTYYDSNEYPKTCLEGVESDHPEHCAGGDECVDKMELSDGSVCGYFFENLLTPEGLEYVRASVNDDRSNGFTYSVACQVWAPCYGTIEYDNYGCCNNCGQYGLLDDFDDCVKDFECSQVDN